MALYFREGDREELLKEVTPLTAVEYLGIETRRCGSSLSILCPSPDHNDQHYGSCMLTRGGTFCKCYACGKHFNALDLILNTKDCSYYEGMCILASLAGRENDFEASARPSSKEQEQDLRFQNLNGKIKSLIGISQYSHIRNFKNCQMDRPESGNFIREESGDYVFYDSGKWNPWMDLIKNDPDTAEWLIRNKCKEKMVEYDYLLRQLKDPFSTKTSTIAYEIMEQYQLRLSMLLKIIKNDYAKIEEIYVNHGGSLIKLEEMVMNLIGMYAVFA